MSDYENFLHRLSAYRQKLNLSKEEMAQMFGVHQSHYGRYENGSRVIGFENLKHFEENGGDLFQLLTGCERVVGPMAQLLDRCTTVDGKIKLLGLLVWGIEFGSWIDNHSQDEAAGSMKKCLRIMELKEGRYSIWECIRKVEDLTQIEMAEQLKIEVKRYRRIEKDEIRPDVEVLCNLYDKFQYSPQIFFDMDKFYIDELNFYWNMLEESTKEFLETIFNVAIERIENHEGK